MVDDTIIILTTNKADITQTQATTDITPYTTTDYDGVVHLDSCDKPLELAKKEQINDSKIFWHNPRKIGSAKKILNNRIKKVIRNSLPVKIRGVDEV